jgi:hypothetical protein
MLKADSYLQKNKNSVFTEFFEFLMVYNMFAKNVTSAPNKAAITGIEQ